MTKEELEITIAEQLIRVSELHEQKQLEELDKNRLEKMLKRYRELFENVNDFTENLLRICIKAKKRYQQEKEQRKPII